MSARLSGRSRGKFPRIASRLGCWRAASTASSLALGSHPGGWITAASTSAASISRSRSSLEKTDTCRRTAAPDMDLRVDNQHDMLLLRWLSGLSTDRPPSYWAPENTKQRQAYLDL